MKRKNEELNREEDEDYREISQVFIKLIKLHLQLFTYKIKGKKTSNHL